MKSLAFVFKFARRYTTPLVLTIVSMILLVGAQLIIPWIVRNLISTVTSDNLTLESFNTITRLAVIALIVYLVKAGLQFVRSYMAHIAGWGVVADLRKLVYNHLQRLNLRFYEDKQTGQMMSRVVNDTDLFEQLIAHAVPELVVNILTFGGVAAVLFSLNWKLTLFSMLPIPLVIFSLRLYAKRVRPAFVFRQKELGELNAILNDNISGIREIKAFTQESVALERVGSRVDHYRKSLLNALKLMATFHPFVEFTSSLGTLVVIYFGGRLVVQGGLPIADLVAFFLYLDLFYQPVRNLSVAWESIQNALAASDRVTELLQEEPEPHHLPGSTELESPVRGQINFENVSFHYSEGENVLENINLDIPAKSVVALVGPTGVGKSTMVSLIPRFYDVTAGKISLDGQDVRKVGLEDLRKQISIVLQDVFLFHGTVRENLLFGKPDASEEEMMAAAVTANAHDFIQQLPNGYDTLIGERGIKLSGGQKQRISIARAILKDAPILILDEATSSVDTETELLIQQALERLMVGRTVILIAHRLSTIRNADQIVVLEGKQIVEKGDHASLLAKNGLYQRLVNVQQLLQPIA
ncbi:MAG: ABC transporter ATP-binding protein [Anaerolineaceae bacterium]|jgi:ATP-binding cassette subfamily B protein/subfamily B ATP-binding cassette protein MsbA|nr:ABC transporter ATP-binding protein [Anaerolineaceae bacterium]